MNTTLSCPAKVNLFLAIGPRGEGEESAFHQLETVLARTDQLQDFIHIESGEEGTGINFQVNFGENMQNVELEDNSVLKAIALLEREAGRKFSYKITLEKNIPPQAGLGGGASDAATILLYLNEAEGLHLPHERLMELAVKIGMDVPFFVSGCQVALGSHYGEQITPLPDLPREFQIKIHLTSKKTSTKKAYADWDALQFMQTDQAASAEAIIQAIKTSDAQGIIANLHNDFDELNAPLISSWTSSVPQPSSAILLAGSGGALVSFYAADTSQ